MYSKCGMLHKSLKCVIFQALAGLLVDVCLGVYICMQSALYYAVTKVEVSNFPLILSIFSEFSNCNLNSQAAKGIYILNILAAKGISEDLKSSCLLCPECGLYVCKGDHIQLKSCSAKSSSTNVLKILKRACHVFFL